MTSHFAGTVQVRAESESVPVRSFAKFGWKNLNHQLAKIRRSIVLCTVMKKLRFVKHPV